MICFFPLYWLSDDRLLFDLSESKGCVVFRVTVVSDMKFFPWFNWKPNFFDIIPSMTAVLLEYIGPFSNPFKNSDFIPYIFFTAG